MQPIQAHAHNTGQLQNASGPEQLPMNGRGTTKNTETSGRVVQDQVDLSPAAKAFIEGAGPGKSGSSPAHMARNYLAQNAGLGDLPFGKIVSAINHGTIDSLIAETTPAAPPDQTGNVAVAATDALPSSEAPAATDGTQPATDPQTPAGDTDASPLDDASIVQDSLPDQGDAAPPATSDASGTSSDQPAASDPATSPVVAGTVDTEAALIDALTQESSDGNATDQAAA